MVRMGLRRLSIAGSSILAALCVGAAPAIAAGVPPGSSTGAPPVVTTTTPSGTSTSVTVVQTTAGLEQAMTALPDLSFSTTPPLSGVPVITIDDGERYQRALGFGAAMTDSSAWLIERGLPAAPRAQILSEMFAPAGLDLSFLRVPIGATDFTVGGRPYSYDSLPPGRVDPQLRHFSIAHDDAYLLPALRSALTIHPGISLLASPWTPPNWMKGNDALGNADGLGVLRSADYGPWAQYIVRFLRAYAAAGVKVGALTPGNEPGVPSAYPGFSMSLADVELWLHGYLVPALVHAHLRERIYGADYGWGTPSAAGIALAGPAAHDISGLAWHCYFGSPDVMSTLHSEDPRLEEIVDECSPGISTIPVSEVVISSLREWASTVALWNLALDPRDGPVQAPDTGCPGCTGLATIDPQTGTFTPRLAWYQLGQASHFIDVGATRVASNTFVTYDYVKRGVNFISASLDDVAFVNPDGTRVLLAYNNSPAPITFAVSWHGQYFEYTLPAEATVTFEWPPGA